MKHNLCHLSNVERVNVKTANALAVLGKKGYFEGNFDEYFDEIYDTC